LSAGPLGETFFRHEYARLVATLSRRFGVRHLEAVEDAAQSALVSALESWTTGGLPENPPAWLFRVAHNHLLTDLRRRARRDRIAAEHGRELAGEAPDEATSAALAGDVRDDLLRMMFACCDDAIPIESQLVLALKTLSGFDVREIAERLFATEASVYKRLERARAQLRALPFAPRDLTEDEMSARLPAVRAILYAIFTEGHLSSRPARALRRELCDEALRLADLLANHPRGATPESFALLALMHLLAARTAAREDDAGGVLLLEEQDRSLWDTEQIEQGLAWLARSAEGDVFSRYHAEAGIAAEHCLAPSFAATRWDRIAECYALLERAAPSPLHTLNRALAVAEAKGPADGLAVLDGLAPPSWLEGSHLWSAVLADLHRRCGHGEAARRYADAALASAPSASVRALLQRRLGR
jgi:RNA polymerase sigma-70 factor (ECF subfamily)